MLNAEKPIVMQEFRFRSKVIVSLIVHNSAVLASQALIMEHTNVTTHTNIAIRTGIILATLNTLKTGKCAIDCKWTKG